MSTHLDFDSSWYEDLPRHISIKGATSSGLHIAQQTSCCKINLGNPLHTLQMKTLFEYWLSDPELYKNTKSGIRYYVGPRSI